MWIQNQLSNTLSIDLYRCHSVGLKRYWIVDEKIIRAESLGLISMIMRRKLKRVGTACSLVVFAVGVVQKNPIAIVQHISIYLIVG